MLRVKTKTQQGGLLRGGGFHGGRRFRRTISRRARLLPDMPDLRPTPGGGFSLPRMAENCRFLEVCPTARHARHVFRRIEGEVRVLVDYGTGGGRGWRGGAEMM